MTPKIDVALRKEDVEPTTVAGRVVVVIDVLIATTTIAYALAHGMPRVLPVLDADAARAAVEGGPADAWLLAGEWLGSPIPSFASIDPRRWPWPAAAAKSLVLASTNGTVALARASLAADLYAAALVNVGAVAQHLAALHPEEDILLVCAGAVGRFGLDDFLAAGCLVARLAQVGGWRLTDAALAALATFRLHASDIVDALALSRTGRWLVQEGGREIVELAAAVDSYPVVARREGGWLVRAGAGA